MEGAEELFKLIVNADDFGFSNGVNYGIIDAHRYGIVNSTTMMVNTPGTAHAVGLAKQNPSLSVGIHLALTFGKPVRTDVPTLVNEHGNFRIDKIVENNKNVSLEEVEREWEAQIEKFLSFGLTPSHFDSHHHIHGWAFLAPVVRRLAEKYSLPVRNVFSANPENIPTLTDVFLDGFYDENVTEQYFHHITEGLSAEKTIEVMCHPAYIDTFLTSNSTYCQKRLTELDILMNTRLPDALSLIEK